MTDTRSPRAKRMHGVDAPQPCCSVATDPAGTRTWVLYCKLHAAAPDLLDALRGMLDTYGENQHGKRYVGPALEAAREAITKAEKG